jgi:hypothetical protein
MYTHVAAVDAGNGAVNAVATRINGPTPQSQQADYFPSVRAVVRGKQLGLGAAYEHQYSPLDWHGQTYIIGDDVTRITKQGLDRFIGKDRYGSEFHQFLVATALARLGVGGKGEEASLYLSLFCPPGFYSEQRDTIRKAFLGKSVSIGFSKKLYQFCYINVSVIPEGQAALFCFNLNSDGTPNDKNPLYGDVLFLDSGVYTLDAVLISDGKVNTEHTHSFPDKGLDFFIRKPLMLAAHQAGRDFEGVTEDDIDLVVRAYAQAKDETEQVKAAVLDVGGYSIDLFSPMQRAIGEYWGWIGNNVLPRFAGLRGIRHLVLLGGGAFLLTPLLYEMFPDKVKNTPTPPYYAAGRISPVNMNVYGGLRVALAKVRAEME